MAFFNPKIAAEALPLPLLAISASFCSQNVTALARPIASARAKAGCHPRYRACARDADIAGKSHGGMAERHVFDDGEAQ